MIYGICKNNLVQNTTTCWNRWIFIQHTRPCKSTVTRIVERFQQSGTVEDQRKEKCSRNGGLQKNIELVRTVSFKNLKYRLVEAHNPLGLVKTQYGVFYNRI